MIFTAPYLRNAFDVAKSITVRREVGGGWALEIETFWAFWIDIEPLGECHLGPEKVSQILLLPENISIS